MTGNVKSPVAHQRIPPPVRWWALSFLAGHLDALFGSYRQERPLDYAHSRQIVHRHVTPTNIMLEGPTSAVKLGDLMLAKALDGALARPITRPGQLLGSVVYRKWTTDKRFISLYALPPGLTPVTQIPRVGSPRRRTAQRGC